jgi:hypothetical protein
MIKPERLKELTGKVQRVLKKTNTKTNTNKNTVDENTSAG